MDRELLRKVINSNTDFQIREYFDGEGESGGRKAWVLPILTESWLEWKDLEERSIEVKYDVDKEEYLIELEDYEGLHFFREKRTAEGFIKDMNRSHCSLSDYFTGIAMLPGGNRINKADFFKKTLNDRKETKLVDRELLRKVINSNTDFQIREHYIETLGVIKSCILPILTEDFTSPEDNYEKERRIQVEYDVNKEEYLIELLEDRQLHYFKEETSSEDFIKDMNKSWGNLFDYFTDLAMENMKKCRNKINNSDYEMGE